MRDLFDDEKKKKKRKTDRNQPPLYIFGMPAMTHYNYNYIITIIQQHDTTIATISYIHESSHQPR